MTPTQITIATLGLILLTFLIHHRFRKPRRLPKVGEVWAHQGLKGVNVTYVTYVSDDIVSFYFVDHFETALMEGFDRVRDSTLHIDGYLSNSYPLDNHPHLAFREKNAHRLPL